MISVFKKLTSPQRRIVRTAYLVLIIFLAGYGYFTHRQLQNLRNRPVALPNYWFYVVDMPVKASLVQAHGTWIVASGPASDQTMQTSTIECNRAKMVCMESTAVVSVKEGSYLEAFPTIYEVDQWSDEALVTKPVSASCAARVLKISLTDRTATTEVAPPADRGDCKEPARTFKMDSGNRASAAPPPAK